jgi:hypothetical protein
MTEAALPHLSEGSAIINTGSITGLEGSKELLDYSATKGAIHAFTKSLSPNLFYSAAAYETDRERARSSGAQGYLSVHFYAACSGIFVQCKSDCEESPKRIGKSW